MRSKQFALNVEGQVHVELDGFEVPVRTAIFPVPRVLGRLKLDRFVLACQRHQIDHNVANAVDPLETAPNPLEKLARPHTSRSHKLQPEVPASERHGNGVSVHAAIVLDETDDHRGLAPPDGLRGSRERRGSIPRFTPRIEVRI